jgi:hypothetical protein
VKNPSKYWVSGDLPTKKRIQETAFPDGLIIDVKNRAYLTKKTNMIFDVSRLLSENKGGERKNGNRDFLLPSSVVERTLKLSNRISSYLSQIDKIKHVDFNVK